MGIASAKLKKNSKACDLSMNSFRMRDMRLTPTLLDIDSPEQFHDFYRLGPCIGSGQYVEVRTCFHRNSDMKRCVKIYRKDLMTTDATKNALELEYGILQSLNHPNIIRLIDHFVESRRIYAVLEFCSLGELYSEIIRKKKLDESVASNIMKQLFSGVAYMHQRNICHRNIKPENILLNEDQIGINVKLTHFGSATHYESNKQIKGTQGTSYYISPEVLGGTYNEKCDL